MKDLHGSKGDGWIGVDLDGTLAFYDGWKSAGHIGEPIPLMLTRVKRWLLQGRDVRIVTARVFPGKPDAAECRSAIEFWLEKHVGTVLPITHAKDHMMIELWDDRVVQVVPNTGERADARGVPCTAVEEFVRQQRAWSDKTFGPGRRTIGITRHIEKELAEIRLDPLDLMEWVDVIILALDGAWRAGHSPESIGRALREKQVRNMTRKWPAEVPEDQPTEHVRGAQNAD
jgi:hypothetical protein